MNDAPAPAAKPPSRTRAIVLLALKIAVAATLVGWLIRGGRLDFGALGLLFERPVLLPGTLGLFALGVFLTTLRWRVLLGLAGVELPLGRAIQLQMTAQFFNV